MIELDNSYESYKPYGEDQNNIIKARMAELMALEHLDEDGYPNEDAFELIKIWHWSDARGWFEFIKSIWAYADWGWHEKDVPHEWKKDTIVHRYEISTAGWSGNEYLIRAMESNSMMMATQWVQSRRGGHYIFELNEIK